MDRMLIMKSTHLSGLDINVVKDLADVHRERHIMCAGRYGASSTH